jgi:hypothetical protein
MKYSSRRLSLKSPPSFSSEDRFNARRFLCMAQSLVKPEPIGSAFRLESLLDVLLEVAVQSADQYGILIRFLFVAFKGGQAGIEFGISVVSFAINAHGIKESFCIGDPPAHRGVHPDEPSSLGRNLVRTTIPDSQALCESQGLLYKGQFNVLLSRLGHRFPHGPAILHDSFRQVIRKPPGLKNMYLAYFPEVITVYCKGDGQRKQSGFTHHSPGD